MRRWRRILTWVARLVATAALLVAAVVCREEIGEALSRAPKVGWRVLFVLPLFSVWTFAAARGWRALVQLAGTVVPTWRLAVIRLQAQAVNLVLPFAGIPGEAARSALLRGAGAAMLPGAMSVAVDALAAVAAGLLFTLIGVALHVGAGALRPAGLIVLLVLIVLLLIGMHLIPTVAALAARWRPGSAMARSLSELAAGPKELRRALRTSTMWHLVERGLTAGEIWLVAAGLGLPLGPRGALFATAVMTGLTLVFFFVPAQLGAAEGGLSLAFAALGLNPAAGLSVALVRRARQLVVAAAGLLLLLLGRGGVQRVRALAVRMQVGEEQGETSASPVSAAR